MKCRARSGRDAHVLCRSPQRVRLQRLDATNNLHDFARDLRLACAVVCHRQLANDLVGVLGGRLHGDHAGDLLADRRVQEALEELDAEAGRYDLLQNALGRRQELVLRLGVPRLAPGRPAPSTELKRQERLDHGFLFGAGHELRVDHVEPIDLAGDVLVQVAIGQYFDIVVRRSVLEVRERLDRA